MSNKPVEFYGKREAGLMAGIAILLMMVDHYFLYKSWLVNGNYWTPLISYHNILERTLSGFGYICIAIFAFSSGYVLYRRPQEYRYGSGLLKRGLKFLTGYWLCLMVFYILAVIFSSPLPNLSELASNMIGLDCAPKKPWVNAPFAWYVTYYLCYLLITPP
jgi:putative flippase GtrA